MGFPKLAIFITNTALVPQEMAFTVAMADYRLPANVRVYQVHPDGSSSNLGSVLGGIYSFAQVLPERSFLFLEIKQ